MEYISWPDQCKLQHLVIDSCIYGEYLDILQKLPYLRTLVMRNCTIDDTHSTLLLLSKFKTPSSLISLTISDCSFSLKNLTLLLSPIPTLLHLKLISHRSILDSFFHGSRLEELIRAKAPALVRFEFFLSYNYQENDQFISLESLMDPFRTPFWLNDKRWFVTCAYVPKGSTIWLHTTPIRDCGIEKLVRCEVSWIDNQCRLTQRSIDEIIDNTDDVTLTTLSLCHNQLGDNGVQYLTDGLRHNKTLITINLDKNLIGDQGAKRLADVLRHNTTLTTLSLNENQIEDGGIKRLADALRHNTTLTMLNLKDNQIGHEGAKRLAEALRANTVIILLCRVHLSYLHFTT
ncbi:unnamed protein product [Adineta steineri]|uniref:RNI-like protein n=1 Tax=Adineta steineri TaxID=433720 RepID=A0A814VY04_9BILA|nr:unnamed protein product [Adineta steineri]